jgi:predicted esterase
VISLILVLLCSAVCSASEAPAGDETQPISRAPEGGLAYRLHVAPVTAGESNNGTSRLAIWMHPSGGRSFNAQAESLAPLFGKYGFSLVVPIEKDFRGWTLEDARKLLAVTIPDVATLEGIDARRPLLIGFSSGGQVALEFWMTKPELYGGLILDAAFPVEKRGDGHVVLAPPKNPAIKQVPILAFVGALDASAIVWQEAEEPWLRAGVPLTVRMIPDRGHDWLIEGSELELLDGWLAELLKKEAARGQVVSPPHEEPAPAVHP